MIGLAVLIFSTLSKSSPDTGYLLSGAVFILVGLGLAERPRARKHNPFRLAGILFGALVLAGGLLILLAFPFLSIWAPG